MIQPNVYYTKYEDIPLHDSMICCDAAGVEDISELPLDDINDFINGMIDFHETGQIPLVDDMFQPGQVSAAEYGKRNLENAIEVANLAFD